jgi:hypothetical protein
MMTSEEAARRIHAQHWRQGRLLPVTRHAEVARHLSLAPLADDDAVIVISQSCDLVNDDLIEEPFAEILLAHPLPGSADGNYMYLRNPRRLHFHLQIDGQRRAYTAWIWDRYRLPREFLAQWRPDDTRGLLDQDEQNVLVSWLAARYERTALPDELQRRFKSRKDQIKKSAKPLKEVSALFLECSDQEFSADEVYRLRVKLVMPKKYYDQPDRRQAVEQMKMRLAAVLEQCPGIVLEEEPELVSELDFSLHDARILRRWTDFDYLSYQDHAAHQAPYPGSG